MEEQLKQIDNKLTEIIIRLKIIQGLKTGCKIKTSEEQVKECLTDYKKRKRELETMSEKIDTIIKENG